MNVRQDKASKRHAAPSMRASKINKAELIATYNNYLRTMPFLKRFIFANTIVFSKYWWSIKDIVLFWK